MKKIMIVDDSSIMRRAIGKYVRALDVEVCGVASNGKAALEIFKRERPEIVTMDVTMPEMDGLACLEEILKIAPETSVVVITALSDPTTGLQAVRKGAKGFLTKPFSEEQLTTEIKQVAGGTQ